MEEVNLEHIDILARRKVNIDYYNWYFLKLDIREHIAQLRVQKENKKKKTLNRQNLIKQMQELCSILHEEYQKLNEEADKRNVFSEELFKEDRYYFLLAKKFFLSRKILKELKQKESENNNEYPFYHILYEDSYLSEADKEFEKQIDKLF